MSLTRLLSARHRPEVPQARGPRPQQPRTPRLPPRIRARNERHRPRLGRLSDGVKE